jgi:hypothetical protein
VSRVRSWAIVGIAAAGAVALVVAATVGWVVLDRTRPVTAAAAGERLRADVETLVSELGLREPAPDILADLGPGGEECGVWSGGGEQLNDEPRRQHRVAVEALPPPGRVATGLAPDAEAILRRLDYRIITDEVDFDTAPPPGIVIATGWRNDVLRIELWPDPEQDTVGVTGYSDCLPA